MRSFKIDVRGHIYRGAWVTDGPDRVRVQSDLGRQSAELRGREPSDVARALLAAMVPRDQR